MYAIRADKRGASCITVGVCSDLESAKRQFKVQQNYSLRKGITTTRIQVVDETTNEVILEDVGEDYYNYTSV
ncbi:MAG: hypothetical protein Q4D21_08345 [Phascolarctobacterium sp.]|nr:hypothetical protein [Phascolarctobacterium sp.]